MLLLLSMVLLSLLMLLKRIELPTIYNFVKQQQMKEVGLMLKKAESHNFFHSTTNGDLAKMMLLPLFLLLLVMISNC